MRQIRKIRKQKEIKKIEKRPGNRFGLASDAALAQYRFTPKGYAAQPSTR
jgi:hypothetical protein